MTYTLIKNAADKLGLPKYHTEDLMVHDREALTGYKGSFLFRVGEMGTSLVTDRKGVRLDITNERSAWVNMFRGRIQSGPQHFFFFSHITCELQAIETENHYNGMRHLSRCLDRLSVANSYGQPIPEMRRGRVYRRRR